MRYVRFSVLVGILLISSGCGQKGPLVLPDAQRPRKKIVVPSKSPPASAAPVPAAPAGPTPAPVQPALPAPDDASTPQH